MASRYSPSGSQSSRRRGAALLLVLGMLAITVAVSYALVRNQTQTVLLQNNAHTAELARQAAEAGLLQAIRKMHVDDWTGVGSTLSGNFDSQSAYSVTFTAGDAALASSDPNYSEYPFRVTVTSTGTAWINGDINYPTTCTRTAVLQLVRRALDTTAVPSRWATMNNYTFYQWNAPGSACDIQIAPPMQITGNSCFMGRLQLFKAYPTDSSARQRYLQDLLTKKLALGPDYRPFTGSVVLGAGRQDAATAGELLTWLGVTNSTAAPIAGDPVSYPSSVSSYRLFPGGPSYAVPTLSSDMVGTVGPNVTGNPLGIYKCTGNFKILESASFTGTLLSDGSSDELRLEGSSKISGFNLPGLSGSSQAYQLPMVLVKNKAVLRDNATVTADGLFMTWNSFVIEPSSGNSSLALTGRLYTNNFSYSGPNKWTSLSSSNWSTALTSFTVQALLPLIGIPYFPDWLESSSYALDPKPVYNFNPSTGVNYHWPNWSLPIYTKGAGDIGLRWNVVSWRDGP